LSEIGRKVEPKGKRFFLFSEWKRREKEKREDVVVS